MKMCPIHEQFVECGGGNGFMVTKKDKTFRKNDLSQLINNEWTNQLNTQFDPTQISQISSVSLIISADTGGVYAC